MTETEKWDIGISEVDSYVMNSNESIGTSISEIEDKDARRECVVSIVDMHTGSDNYEYEGERFVCVSGLAEYIETKSKNSNTIIHENRGTLYLDRDEAAHLIVALYEAIQKFDGE